MEPEERHITPRTEAEQEAWLAEEVREGVTRREWIAEGQLMELIDSAASEFTVADVPTPDVIDWDRFKLIDRIDRSEVVILDKVPDEPVYIVRGVNDDHDQEYEVDAADLIVAVRWPDE